MGAMIASDAGLRAVRAAARSRSPTASPSAAIRSPPRWRWPTSTSSSARTSAGTCCARRASSAAMLDGLRDIPIVGDVRGDGFFHAIELVKDQETKEGFTDEESEWLLRGFLSGELYRRGLICRADDRGDPVIQLAPPLICDTEQFEEIDDVLRPVLTEACGAGAGPAVELGGGQAMLTVGSLVADCGLELAAGAAGAERPVRWVHISEHEDPTPWLSGGELLLTTGYNLPTPAKQRRYVELLAGEGLAGLGFGTGFDHKRMPKAIRRRRRGPRAAAVRGPLRDAVHRDHRARRRAARQRAVRRARARRPRARAARAAGDRGPRARARSSPRPAPRSAARRSSSIAPAASSRAAPAEPIPTPPRRPRRSAPRSPSRRRPRRRPRSRPRRRARRPRARRAGARAAAAPPRSPGSRWSRSTSRSATSSASAPARRRSSSGSS